MRAQNQHTGCQRMDPRSANSWDARVYRRDGRRSDVTVSDMSLGGIQIEGASFADDEVFCLVIPQLGGMNARARWSGDVYAGAQFDEQLILEDAIPPRDAYVMRRLRSFNFGSGRSFGKRVPSPD